MVMAQLQCAVSLHRGEGAKSDIIVDNEQSLSADGDGLAQRVPPM